MRFEARHEGREVWRPPALYELIDVEVEDEHTRAGEPQWRTAHVRRVLVDGRFQVCMHRAEATPALKLEVQGPPLLHAQVIQRLLWVQPLAIVAHDAARGKQREGELEDIL